MRGATLLEGMEPAKKLTTCKIRTYKITLGVNDQMILIDALANPVWTNAALSRALTDRGLVVSDKTIKAHREKRCSC
jgi:hypothetical protein